MPLYLYECGACSRVSEHLHGLREPSPTCCGSEQRRRMPRRVRAVVLGPGQAVTERAAEERREGLLARAGDRPPPRREPSPVDIPGASYSGPPRDAADRAERWRDTTEAMAHWQARSLAADGLEYGAAKRKAEQHQQAVSAAAEAEASN